MVLITLLSNLLFGADVDRLGDASYQVRDAAHCRLARAYLLAYPALKVGPSKPNLESSYRVEILLSRFPDCETVGLLAFLHEENVSDSFINTLSRQMAEDSRLCARFCGNVDRLQGFYSCDSMYWISMKPYATGTRAGDVKKVLVESRLKWFSKNSKPVVPSAMPEPISDQ
jgi:hypothetical protein